MTQYFALRTATVVTTISLLWPIASTAQQLQTITSTGTSTTAAAGCTSNTDCVTGEYCVGADPAQNTRGTCRAGTAPAASDESTPAVQLGIDKPKLNVPDPIFSLSRYTVVQSDGTRTVISIPWIGEYLAAVYRFAVPFGAILAVIVIMVAGIMWMTSGGAKGLSTAKEWITNAVVGLLLLVGSYVVLSTINPDLVTFKNVQIQIAEPVVEPTEAEADSVVLSIEPTEDIGVISGENIINDKGQTLDRAHINAIQEAALALRDQGYQLMVTSGFRSEQRQIELIQCYCNNPPGSQSCNPKDSPCDGGAPTQTCILQNGPISCPHTTGRAVDAWGAKDGKQCISKKKCLQNIAACRSGTCTPQEATADPSLCAARACQAALIQQMKDVGQFCNLCSEPWHFEKPAMSSNCTC